MNARKILTSGAMAATVIAAIVLFWQRQQLSSLESQHRRLAASITPSMEPASGTEPAPVSSPPPLTPEERIELMELRNLVSTLREKQRSLAGVSNEAIRLRDQSSQVNRFASGQFPPGYLHRTSAQWRGVSSPEATLESFLWALQSRNTNAILSVLTPGAATRLAQRWAASGPEEFFEQMGALPGYRLLNRNDVSHDFVELKVDFDPTSGFEQDVQMRLIGGGWRFEM